MQEPVPRRRPHKPATMPPPPSLVDIVTLLADAGDWYGIRVLLTRLPRPPPQRAYFLDTDLVSAVVDNSADSRPSQLPHKQAVLNVVLPSIPALARFVDTFAATATHEQVDQMLEDVRNVVHFLHKQRYTDTTGVPAGTLFTSDQNTTVVLAELLRQLSAATLAKVTARTVRTFAVSGPKDESEDFETLQVLLTRRPDLDPNTLLADGKPAWYTGWWKYVLAVTSEGAPRIPRIDVNTPFVIDGVTAPLLEHMLREYALHPHPDVYVNTDYWSTFEQLLDNGAQPVDHDAAASIPLSGLFSRFVHVDNERDAEWALEAGGEVDVVAQMGLFPQPEDIAALTVKLGADSPALARLLAVFAPNMRWQRRASALQALYEGTQQQQLGAGAWRPAQRARIMDPAAQTVLSAVFDGARRVVPDDDDDAQPYRLGHVVAKRVVGFLGGRHHR